MYSEEYSNINLKHVKNAFRENNDAKQDSGSIHAGECKANLSDDIVHSHLVESRAGLVKNRQTDMDAARTRLQNNDPSLTCLSLNEVDDALEAAISGNTFLQELTIRNTPMISTTLFAIVSENLQQLRLDNVGMTVQSLKENSKKSQQRINPRLQELSLANNPKLGPRGCQELRRELLRFPNLIVLNLENIGMGHYGAQGIEFPPNLQSLNLSHNKLGIDGIWKLTLPLHSLVELNVSHNAILDDGCMELTKILPMYLRSLTLSSNGIGTLGMEALAKALQSHGSLQELYISDNRIQHVDALAELLARPATTELDESWEPLSQCSLRVLDVSHNQLESTACLTLAEALRTNTTLQRLDLSYNRIDDEGAGGFVEILDDNSGLQELLLAGNKSISDARQRILDMLLKHRAQRVHILMDDNASTERTVFAQGAVSDESAGLILCEFDQEQVQNGYGLLESALQSTEPPCLVDGGADLLGFVAHVTRQYDLRYVVSYGAFGVLYRLNEQKSLLVRSLRLRDPNNRANAIVQEIKTLHQHHISSQPTIAPIVALTCSEIIFAFVYHVPGLKSLAEVLREHGDTLSWIHRIHILQNVTTALNCLHSTMNGTPSSFHGDVSSQTIYVSEKMNDSGLTVQLLDCSLTRLPTVDPARWLSGDVVYGTRGYRCPRYERGSCRYDSFSDMFSLGIVVAELLTGRLQASKHDSGTAWDVYYECILRKQPLMADRAIGPPPGENVLSVLGRIIGLCLSPNVQQRPTSSFVLQLLDQMMKDMSRQGE